MRRVQPKLRLVRVYELAEADEGFRVLVDRLWPRGTKQEALRLDRWAKELAPTTALRQWFSHDPDKWEVFQQKYNDELAQNHNLIRSLLDDAGNQDLLLLYAAKDQKHNHAIVLRDYIQKKFL